MYIAPSHVIFDLDGTLLDSSEGIVNSFRATLDELALSATESQLRGLIGPPLWHSFRTLGVDDDALDAAVDIYRRYYAEFGVFEAVPYPGIADVLEEMRDAGLRLGVATAKRVDFAKQMLGEQQMAQYFDIIAGADVGLVLTEKYDIIDQVLRHWEVAGASTRWMVGDRSYDIEAARRHGLTTIGVTWGFGSEKELLDAGAHALVDTARELLGPEWLEDAWEADVQANCRVCGRVRDAEHDGSFCPGAEAGS